MGFIKAEPGIKHSVIYTDDTGNYFRYSGGTWAWRNNNPGNCRPGKISKSHGQIGVVFNFAVFPDKESGHLALLDVLKITYANSSIYEMMMVFAPPKENNTAKYIKFLREATGVKDDRPISEFNDNEFEKLWRGIEQIEGYKEGEIVPIHKITHVRQDKAGCICDYYIDSTGWIVKESCIALARLNKVELEVCTSRLGHTYLKSASHSSFQPNLKKLVQKKPRK
jgi:hypothetical protein